MPQRPKRSPQEKEGRPPARWSDEARIVALFAEPKKAYSRAEVARLTRTPRRDLDALLETHSITPRGGGLYSWEDVAFLAMVERWGVRRIAAALLRNGRPVPPLNRLRRLRVEVPEHQIRALEQEAACMSETSKTRWSLSDVLTVALSDWIALRGAEGEIENADRWPLGGR